MLLPLNLHIERNSKINNKQQLSILVLKSFTREMLDWNLIQLHYTTDERQQSYYYAS